MSLVEQLRSRPVSLRMPEARSASTSGSSSAIPGGELDAGTSQERYKLWRETGPARRPTEYLLPRIVRRGRVHIAELHAPRDIAIAGPTTCGPSSRSSARGTCRSRSAGAAGQHDGVHRQLRRRHLRRRQREAHAVPHRADRRDARSASSATSSRASPCSTSAATAAGSRSTSRTAAPVTSTASISGAQQHRAGAVPRATTSASGTRTSRWPTRRSFDEDAPLGRRAEPRRAVSRHRSAARSCTGPTSCADRFAILDTICHDEPFSGFVLFDAKDASHPHEGREAWEFHPTYRGAIDALRYAGFSEIIEIVATDDTVERPLPRRRASLLPRREVTARARQTLRPRNAASWSAFDAPAGASCSGPKTAPCSERNAGEMNCFAPARS